MRDPKRIDRILKLIENSWKRYPDLRLGQLLINLGIVKDDVATWRIEDKDWEEYLKEHELVK